jgi:hypothetical protein
MNKSNSDQASEPQDNGQQGTLNGPEAGLNNRVNGRLPKGETWKKNFKKRTHQYGSEQEKKDAFVRAIERKYVVNAALRATGVTWDEYDRWMADEDFQRKLEIAREGFVDDMELQLIRMAKGRVDRRLFQPTIAFLNNNHESYGLIRQQIMHKMMRPLLEDLGKIVSEHVGKDVAEQIRVKMQSAAFDFLAKTGP